MGRKKTNLMFIGDGKGITVVSGAISVLENHVTTFRTATFGEFPLSPAMFYCLSIYCLLLLLTKTVGESMQQHRNCTWSANAVVRLRFVFPKTNKFDQIKEI